MKIDTSSTRDVGKILDSILSHCDQFDSNTKELVELTHQLFNTNQFDSLHDNIAKIAPELKVGLIHRTSSNVGSNIESKNDGGAFARCLHTKSIVFHAMAFVPDKHNVILISKIQASMKKDEKTREKTAEGEAPDYQTYLVINELKFVETNNLTDKHALGVFTEVVRSYCFGDCVAGEGDCIHKMIQLWIQFHHWTDERLGIDRPPTLDNCSWGAGKPLESGVTKMLHEQQCVKHCMSVEEQISKNERGSKRACTEGVSAVYKVYASKAKQNRVRGARFTGTRCIEFFEALREESDVDDGKSDDDEVDGGEGDSGEDSSAKEGDCGEVELRNSWLSRARKESSAEEGDGGEVELQNSWWSRAGKEISAKEGDGGDVELQNSLWSSAKASQL